MLHKNFEEIAKYGYWISKIDKSMFDNIDFEHCFETLAGSINRQISPIPNVYVRFYELKLVFLKQVIAPF